MGVHCLVFIDIQIIYILYICVHCNRQTCIKAAQKHGQSHDTPGKGELAVMTGKVQISRVNINVQLDLCTPPFFLLLLTTMAFSCSATSCQATHGSDMSINKCGFMLLSLPMAGFYDAVFSLLICKDKQLWTWDGAEELYNILLFMTLWGWLYSIGHTVADDERGSWGVTVRLFAVSLYCLYLFFLFFSEVKTRLLLVLLQYTGLSSCNNLQTIIVVKCVDFGYNILIYTLKTQHILVIKYQFKINM